MPELEEHESGFEKVLFYMLIGAAYIALWPLVLMNKYIKRDSEGNIQQTLAVLAWFSWCPFGITYITLGIFV